MSGHRDLRLLLKNLEPELSGGEFVFVSLPDATPDTVRDLSPIGIFQEDEGKSLIVTKSAADLAGLKYEGRFRQITLRVHSSLHAVGLTAVIADACAEHEIPINVVAAFHHDHLFVPAESAEAALEILRRLAFSNG